MFYESWLQGHSLSHGWTILTFLDITLRVSRVIRDVQSMTCSILVAADLKVWDFCQFIASRNHRGCFSRGNMSLKKYSWWSEALLLRRRTRRLFPFRAAVDTTKLSTKRGSLG